MRPRRARCIVAPGCGRAWRGGTCTFIAWLWRGARRARPRRARCIVAPGCGRAWRGGTCTFTVWRWRGARRARGARGACGAAVSGVARRWAASRWRRCGCAGRGASLRPAAAAHGEEVRALAHERSDAEAGSWCDAVALRVTRCALARWRRCADASMHVARVLARTYALAHTTKGEHAGGFSVVGLWRGGGQARAVA